MINELNKIKKKYPSQRYGQIIWNALNNADKWQAPEGNPLFFITDSELDRILSEYEELVESGPDNKLLSGSTLQQYIGDKIVRMESHLRENGFNEEQILQIQEIARKQFKC